MKWMALALLAVSACEASEAAPAPPPTAPLGTRAELNQLPGKPLYLALCRPCHGNEGKGYTADHAPSLVSSTFLASASDGFLQQSIATGRPGTSMAAYSQARGGPLDDASIARLVGFLRAQGPAAAALPVTAVGDAAVGATVYAKHCWECHGDATTRADAVWLGNLQFQAQASDAFLRYAVVHGRPGTKMAAFAGVLSDGEIDGVVRYVRGFGDRAPTVTMLPAPTGKEPIVLNPRGSQASFSLRADPCPMATPGSPGAPTCKPDPRFVSIDQVAKALAAKQRVVIIDARPASEWMRVHVTGAVSIPYHELNRLAEVPNDGTWVVAYCACPHHLSGIVVDELRKRGYAHSAVLDEGINEWHRRGLPVVAAPGVAPPVPEMPPPAGVIR